MHTVLCLTSFLYCCEPVLQTTVGVTGVVTFVFFSLQEVRPELSVLLQMNMFMEKSNISKRPTWIRRPRVLRQGKKQADSLHVLWRGKKAFSITISDWLLSHCFFSHEHCSFPNTAAYVGCSKKDHINIYGPWVIQCVTSVLILKSSVSFSSISLTVLLNWDSDVIFSHILDSMCAGSDCLTISGILL